MAVPDELDILKDPSSHEGHRLRIVDSIDHLVAQFLQVLEREFVYVSFVYVCAYTFTLLLLLLLLPPPS